MALDISHRANDGMSKWQMFRLGAKHHPGWGWVILFTVGGALVAAGRVGDTGISPWWILGGAATGAVWFIPVIWISYTSVRDGWVTPED